MKQRNLSLWWKKQKRIMDLKIAVHYGTLTLDVFQFFLSNEKIKIENLQSFHFTLLLALIFNLRVNFGCSKMTLEENVSTRLFAF